MTAEWLEAVKPVVRAAGLKLRRGLHGGGRARATQKPNGGGWVTPYDQAAEDYIGNELQRLFPRHGFLGEEYGLQGDADNCWVLDPLDGTTNFIHRHPQCAVSLAFCKKGRSQLALIYDIAADDLYVAAEGRGAQLNGERIRVSGETSFRRSLFLLGGQINADLMPLLTRLAGQCDGMRRLGATALDFAYLAAGRVDAVVSGPVLFWDVAAGQLLLREAGGLLSDVNDATAFAFNQETASFVAATPRVFAKFFSEVKKSCRAAEAQRAAKP